LTAQLMSSCSQGSVVLLKGSRGMRMENILRQWKDRTSSANASSGVRAKIAKAQAESIQEAARLIQAGLVVGMPTETVYGLAGDALNETALTRIFSTKERPTFDPLIVHITLELLEGPEKDSSLLQRLEDLGLIKKDALSDLAKNTVETLGSQFWPGPLTLVLPRGEKVPDLVSSGLPTVALRVPAHPVAQALINAAGVPLAAPSANRFGRISPTNAQAVDQELGDRIPYILDGGECDIGVESTVVSVTETGEPTLLRPGGVPKEAISEALGTECISPIQAPAPSAPLLAPGMLLSHYAPRKPLTLLPKPFRELDWTAYSREFREKRVAILLQFGSAPAQPRIHFETLTETNDRTEAARNLFSHLRAMDASDAELLFAEPSPTLTGLDYAIADRLRRAAAPRD
jgi:L-threonylcarbamoyladenylate synthase